MDRSRTGLVAALVGYLAFVAYQSLAGAAPGACVTPLLQQGSRLSRGDGLANLVAYVPLGLLAAARLASMRNRGLAFGIAFSLASMCSLSMELLQACLPGRVSSWYDWVTNSAGGLLGAVALPAAARLARALRTRPGCAAAMEAPLGWPAALCVGAWLLLVLAPWRFTLDVGTLRGNLAFLKHAADAVAGFEPWRALRYGFGWMAIGFALRASGLAVADALRLLALLVAAAVLGQVLLAVPSLSFEELAGMALALAATALAGANGAGPRLPAAFALLSVLAYQLAPQPGVPAPDTFSWWPRIGRGGLLGALELALLFGWLGAALSLSLRALAQRGADVSRRRVAWPAATAGVLLLTEIAQGWIPGRSPDTSAPLVMLLGFMVAWALGGAPPSGAAPARPRPVRRMRRATARAAPTSRRPAA